MIRRITLTSLVAAATAMAAIAPAYAGTWTYTGPHGAVVNHWGPGPHYWGSGPCCYGGAVAAGAIAGLAVGTVVGAAAASRPVYVAPPPVVYAPPPVVYAPGPYYYAP
jgi:hypothetical protein